MNNEWTTILGFGGIICAMFLVYGSYILWNKRRSKERLLRKIREDWGSWPAREYDFYDWEAVEGYYNNKACETFQIDDITWEDLDLSRVFMLLNHTASFIGEGYLYYLLRTPSFEEEELKERERLITYFQEHVEEREKMQMFFHGMGKAGRSSIFDAVYNLAQVQTISNMHHYLMIGLLLASVVFLLLAPTPGILVLIVAMCITMQDYYKQKRTIEKYIISCRFLLKTLEAAREMVKIEIPEISEYQDRIRKASQRFGRLKRNTFFLMNGARTDADLLAGIIMYLNSCFHVDLIQFATVVKEMKKYIPEFEILVENMGRIETAISIGSFRQCMKEYCIPELTYGSENGCSCGENVAAGAEDTQDFVCGQGMDCGQSVACSHGICLEAEELYHPLIQEPVKNSIRANRNVLLTGSNASGKSTFLKTVAINAVLAQTVHTCMADFWKSPYFRVYSSMALQDNLEGQESYYIVEIKSLKRIMDAVELSGSDEQAEAAIWEHDAQGTEDAGCAKSAHKKAPVLCFVDEVLRGTNTVERVAASSQVLRYMTGKPVLCFAATHDIELTHILEDCYDNYHFQEEVEENDIRFDYCLYPGRATSRNAIKLLQIMGYTEEVIGRAERMAQNFLETGEWKDEA